MDCSVSTESSCAPLGIAFGALKVSSPGGTRSSLSSTSSPLDFGSVLFDTVMKPVLLEIRTSLSHAVIVHTISSSVSRELEDRRWTLSSQPHRCERFDSNSSRTSLLGGSLPSAGNQSHLNEGPGPSGLSVDFGAPGNIARRSASTTRSSSVPSFHLTRE